MTEKLNLPAVSFMGDNALPPEIGGYAAGDGAKWRSSLISEVDAVGADSYPLVNLQLKWCNFMHCRMIIITSITERPITRTEVVRSHKARTVTQ